ncbi:MAG: hypothetical protein ACQEVA_17325 [Myxococcota bacterium]
MPYKEAQRVIDRVVRKMADKRPDIVLKHDIKTVNAVQKLATERGTIPVIVTWDRLLQRAAKDAHQSWWCMDPIHAAEILAFGKSDPSDVRIPLTTTLALDEPTATRGAEILDAVVRLERENMYDADLAELALRFKSEFAGRQSDETGFQIAQEWQSWKAEQP